MVNAEWLLPQVASAHFFPFSALSLSPENDVNRGAHKTIPLAQRSLDSFRCSFHMTPEDTQASSAMPKHSTFTFHFVNARESIAVGSALPGVCLIVVALRFWTRRLQKVHIGMDDWWAVVGLVSDPC